MKTFGEELRELRESKKLLLRQVASSLDLDTALVSKFERGERKPSKDQVLAFAKFYNTNVENLLVAWFSDKIAVELENEEVAVRAIQEAEKKIKSHKRKR